MRRRKVLFMLDSSRGLGPRELPTVTTFMKDIVRALYKNRNSIEVGLMQYSDYRTAQFDMAMGKWSLREALRRIQFLKYRPGVKNYVGSALKIVEQV